MQDNRPWKWLLIRRCWTSPDNKFKGLECTHFVPKCHGHTEMSRKINGGPVASKHWCLFCSRQCKIQFPCLMHFKHLRARLLSEKSNLLEATAKASSEFCEDLSKSESVEPTIVASSLLCSAIKRQKVYFLTQKFSDVQKSSVV